uniref:Uncharacterized protein n=1 Tax=Plectus sambesii TaxID=2011161 RepID=A0A914XCW9_9BILA
MVQICETLKLKVVGLSPVLTNPLLTVLIVYGGKVLSPYHNGLFVTLELNKCYKLSSVKRCNLPSAANHCMHVRGVRWTLLCVSTDIVTTTTATRMAARNPYLSTVLADLEGRLSERENISSGRLHERLVGVEPQRRGNSSASRPSLGWKE